jgi:hypothetical protein
MMLWARRPLQSVSAASLRVVITAKLTWLSSLCNSLLPLLSQRLVLLGHPIRLPRRDTRDQTRVQSSRKQHSVRHLRHQSLPDGVLQGRADLLQVGLLGGHGLDIGRQPRGRVVAGQRLFVRVVEMAGRERDQVVAFRLDALHLGREEERVGRGRVEAHVQGGDADRIPSGDEARGRDGCVDEDEGEHAVQLVAEVGAVFLVLRYQLAQTAGLPST